jgi:hypothetical protein
MRTALLPSALGLALALAACSKPAQKTTPEPAPAAAPAPAPAQGIAAGEPNPATPTDGRPASVTDADVAFADRMVDVMAKLSANVVAAGSDCQQAATEIRTIVPEVQKLTAEGKQMEDKLKADAAAKEWFEKNYAPKIGAIMGKMMGSSCMQDPAVREALASLNV